MSSTKSFSTSPLPLSFSFAFSETHSLLLTPSSLPRLIKASNMNFACALSLRVEEIMDEIRPVPTPDEADHWIWTDDDEGEIYDEALQRALEESSGVAWAAGNIRM